MKPKKFKRKSDAIEAVDECQRHGWKAGIYGRGPWFVNAITVANGFRIIHDLHQDGFMREYTRKEITE